MCSILQQQPESSAFKLSIRSLIKIRLGKVQSSCREGIKTGRKNGIKGWPYDQIGRRNGNSLGEKDETKSASLVSTDLACDLNTNARNTTNNYYEEVSNGRGRGVCVYACVCERVWVCLFVYVCVCVCGVS